MTDFPVSQATKGGFERMEKKEKTVPVLEGVP